MTKDPNKIGLIIIAGAALIGLAIGIFNRPKLPDIPKEGLSLPQPITP